MDRGQYPPGFKAPGSEIISMTDDNSDDESEYLNMALSTGQERKKLLFSMFQKPNVKNNTPRKKDVQPVVPKLPLRRSTRGKENASENLIEDLTPCSASHRSVLKDVTQMNSSPVASTSTNLFNTVQQQLLLNCPLLQDESEQCKRARHKPDDCESPSSFQTRDAVEDATDKEESDRADSDKEETEKADSNKEETDKVDSDEEEIFSDNTALLDGDGRIASFTESNNTLGTTKSNNYDKSSNLFSEESNQSDVENGPPKKKRRPQKKRRCLGLIITSENCLPNLSEGLDRDLKNGIVKRIILNREVKDFVLEKTGDQHLTQDEWGFLCSSLIEKYPVLSDADEPKGYKDLKYRLQNSITSERSYKNNGVPSRRKTVPIRETPTRDNSTAEIHDPLLLELRTVIKNRERVKFLIKETFNLRKNENLEADERLQLYPHYKNGEMLLYEYSLSISQDESSLQERAEELILKLGPDTEEEATLEQEMQCLTEVQTQLQPNALKNKNIKSALICRDACGVWQCGGLGSGACRPSPLLCCCGRHKSTRRKGHNKSSPHIQEYYHITIGWASAIKNPHLLARIILLSKYYVPSSIQQFLETPRKTN